MITINGTEVKKSEIRLAEYLLENNYATSRIVIEINGNILPRESYNKTILYNNDKIEILTFVGGG